MSRNIAPTTAATTSPICAATRTPAIARSGLPAPRFWPGDGGGCAHQADRCPGDQREELRIADRVGGLGCGALLERADKPQEQETPDVHRDSLHAGRQAEPKQRSNDGEVRTEIHLPIEVNDRFWPHQAPDTVRRYERAARDRAVRGAHRTERWNQAPD